MSQLHSFLSGFCSPKQSARKPEGLLLFFTSCNKLLQVTHMFYTVCLPASIVVVVFSSFNFHDKFLPLTRTVLVSLRRFSFPPLFFFILFPLLVHSKPEQTYGSCIFMVACSPSAFLPSFKLPLHCKFYNGFPGQT